MEDIMTLEEVAKYLKVKLQTIYIWAQNCRIPVTKMGKEIISVIRLGLVRLQCFAYARSVSNVSFIVGIRFLSLLKFIGLPPENMHNTMAGIPVSVREALRMELSIRHTLFQYAGIFPSADAYSSIFLQLRP